MNEPPSPAPGRPGLALSTSGAYLTITLTVFLWASGIVIARGVHETIPPIGLTFWRWFIAAIVMLPFVWRNLRDQAPVITKHSGTPALAGLLMVGSGTLIIVALNFTTAINATLVHATQPAITAVLAWIMVRESLSTVQLLGVAAALFGIGVMVSEADWRVIAAFEFNIGDILVILAIVGYAVYAIRLRKLPHELNVATSLFVIMLLGSLTILPLYILESLFMKTVPLTMTTVLAVIGLSVFASTLALLMWNAGNHKVGPNRAAIFVNLMPVFGAALAIGFLGERLFIFHVIGAALVFAGIVLVVRKKSPPGNSGE